MITRHLLILAAVVLLLVSATAALLAPKLHNLASEYETAAAIRDVKEYVRQHEGKWPAAPEDLGGKYPTGGKVQVDYAMTSGKLMEHPELLREALRPRSGKFLTYPHYQADLDGLLAVLREMNGGVK